MKKPELSNLATFSLASRASYPGFCLFLLFSSSFAFPFSSSFSSSRFPTPLLSFSFSLVPILLHFPLLFILIPPPLFPSLLFIFLSPYSILNFLLSFFVSVFFFSINAFIFQFNFFISC